MLTKLEETRPAQSVYIGSSQVSGVCVSKVDGVDSKSQVQVKGQIVQNPSTLVAALPNLVRHLRQPVGQREEAHQHNHPTVAVSASNPSRITSTSTQFAGVSTASIISSQSRMSHVQQPQILLPSSSQSMTNKNSNGQENQQLSGGSATAKVPVSTTDLSQPVPLSDLIKHGFIKPGVDCISCVVMVRNIKIQGCSQFRGKWEELLHPVLTTTLPSFQKLLTSHLVV